MRTLLIILVALSFSGCSLGHDPNGSQDGAGSGGSGSGATPPSVTITAITVAGTLDHSATVTVDGQADQDAGPTTWSRQMPTTSGTLASGLDIEVVADDGTSTSTVMIEVSGG